MADSDRHTTGGHHEYSEGGDEVKDRGLLDFLGKKEGGSKPGLQAEEQEVVVTEFDHKMQVSAPPSYEEVVTKTEEAEKPSLIEKLHRSGSSSSSSSDEEEVEEGGEKIKKKKKKGLKEKIKEKISGEKEEEKIKEEEDVVVASIPIEKCDEVSEVAPHPEEKKGFLEKIKEKLPGGHKKPEECTPVPPVVEEPVYVHEEENKEKKGILEKIKEKLPGYHKSEEEKKECD